MNFTHFKNLSLFPKIPNYDKVTKDRDLSQIKVIYHNRLILFLGFTLTSISSLDFFQFPE